MTQSFQNRQEEQGGKKGKRTRGEDAQQDSLGTQGKEQEQKHDGKQCHKNHPETPPMTRTDGCGI